VPAVIPLSSLFGIEPSRMSKTENIIIETYLLSKIHKHLINFFKSTHKNNFYSIKLGYEMEYTMLESDISRLLISDILSTEEYTLQGIATYTNSHPDIIVDVAAGRNIPTAPLYQRILDLHITVRRNLYDCIVKKILFE